MSDATTKKGTGEVYDRADECIDRGDETVAELIPYLGESKEDVDARGRRYAASGKLLEACKRLHDYHAMSSADYRAKYPYQDHHAECDVIRQTLAAALALAEPQ